MTGSSRAPVTPVFYLASFLLYLSVLLARTTNSLTRLPSDPGYSYIQDGADEGLPSLLLGDPYLHVAARALAWITSWIPIAAQAVVLATLVHLVWAGCAVAIAHVGWLETRSRVVTLLAGLFLVAAPHASESSLGNIGNVKWPLLTTLLVMCASAATVQRAKVPTVALMMLTGLTNPLTILCLFPLGLIAWRRADTRTRAVRLGAVCLLTLVIQLTKVGVVGATGGRFIKVTSAWEGMGLFWWSGLLGPIALSTMVLIAMTALRITKRKPSDTSLGLAVTALLVATILYQMGGIADRYFVAPMTLAILATLLTVASADLPIGLKRLVSVAGLIMLLVPSIKWFSTGWYLTGGPTWAQEVRRANELCTGSSEQDVEIALTPSGTVILDCNHIIHD